MDRFIVRQTFSPSSERKGEHGGESGRVTMEEISMDIVEGTLDLMTTSISAHENAQK
jgi:hypothetical protein